MARRVVVIVALAIAVWGFVHFTGDGPVPSEESLVSLADEEWQSTSCYNIDYQWPCAVVTDIRLDRTSLDWEPRDKGDDYRACFDINLQLENTRWDDTQRAPAEPRTYIQATQPLHRCADVSYFMGPADEPGSWMFAPVGENWKTALTKQMRDQLCSPADAFCP